MARLLVVGEEAWCVNLSGRLGAAGHDVTSTSNAIEAVRLAVGCPPAALITQATLPGHSGVQLCRLLRAELAIGEIPVVIVTEGEALGAAFEARAAGAASHVCDVDALIRTLPAIVARPNLPVAVPPPDAELLVARLSSVLDRALYEAEIAAEVRALAWGDDLDAMFEGLVEVASKVLPYAWLGLVVNGERPRFLLQTGRDHVAAEHEARAALDLSSSIPCQRVERVAPALDGGHTALEVPIFFGDSLVGQLAVALPASSHRATKRTVGLVAYELGGPLRIMALLEQVQRQAATDALTGLMNRRAFLEATAREEARSSRHGYGVSLLIVDIDHFKDVNDRHGHPAGDAVLHGVATVLASSVRAGDIVCRWGGEEFLVALPQADLAGALVAAEHIRESIEGMPFSVPGGSAINVTVSIGASSSASPWRIPPLVAAADTALYNAKQSGRNRVCAGPARTSWRRSA